MYCWLDYFCTSQATTQISTLSLHDALPIFWTAAAKGEHRRPGSGGRGDGERGRGILADPHRARVHPRGAGDRSLSRAPRRRGEDRKSTRLNSSHGYSAYAVVCLNKKTSTDD